MSAEQSVTLGAPLREGVVAEAPSSFWRDPSRRHALDMALGELSELRRVGFVQVEACAPGQVYSAAFAFGSPLFCEPPVVSSGCIAELLLAVLALELDHKGLIDLDMTVSKILTELNDWPPAEAITLRHLLTRTAGIQDPRSPMETVADLHGSSFVDRLRQAPSLFTPGVAFCYAGADVPILFEALQRVAECPVEEAIRQIILDSLDIALRPLPGLEPGRDEAGLGVTVQDLGKFAQALAQPRPDRLHPDIVARLLTRKVDLAGGLSRSPARHAFCGFSEGGFLFSDGLAGYDGQSRGHACAIRFDPATGFSVAVGVDGGPHIRDAAVELIVEAAGYRDSRPVTYPCVVGRLDSVRWQEVCGRYEGWQVGHAATVSCDGERLSVTRSFDGRPLKTLDLALSGADLGLTGPGELTSIRFFRDEARGRIGFMAGGLPYAQLAEG